MKLANATSLSCSNTSRVGLSINNSHCNITHSGHFDNLSEGSQQKFSNGSILQILDSKDKGDQNIIANAPTIQSVASTESKERFEMVLDGLAAVGINYKIDHTLVRGLDYYTSTVWEFTTNHLGVSLIQDLYQFDILNDRHKVLC
eukprot:m.165149 g.165149  ORF g.165149 m.165149 type:complete len:145 (-) comp15252_c0_seq15:2202-2636(-)